MITLYKCNNLPNISKQTYNNMSEKDENSASKFSNNLYNSELEERLEKDLFQFGNNKLQEMINRLIINEFGKEMPKLASKVNTKIMSKSSYLA